MNKYSKRALKTTATVGMSLAMVLSGVAAPAVTNVKAATTCLASDLTSINDKFTEAGITLDTMKTFNSDSEVSVITNGSNITYYELMEAVADVTLTVGSITIPATGYKVAAADVSSLVAATGDFKKAFKGTADGVKLYAGADLEHATTEVTTANANTVIIANAFIVFRVAEANIVKTSGSIGNKSDKKLFQLITNDWKTELNTIYANCSGDEAKIANYLLTLEKDVLTMFGPAYDNTTVYGILKQLDDKLTPYVANDYRVLTDFKAKYSENLNDVQSSDLNKVIRKIEDALGYDSSLDSYQTQLAALVDTINTNFEKFIELPIYITNDLATATSITKSAIEAQIKVIKNMTNYTKFANESSVKEAIAQFTDLNNEIADVKKAVDTRANDAYKAFLDGGSKSVKAKYAPYNFTFGTGVGATKDGISIVGIMKTADFEVYKTFKEEVVDVVYTLASKESVSRYVDKSTKSPFATVDQTTTVLADFNISLSQIQDHETGEFGWDLLADHMEEVVSSLEIINKKLEKLDAITLVSGDRDTLIALDDAVYFLKNGGVNNLTSAQTRVVRDADRKVTELLEAYRVKFGSIDTKVNGWVNRGNGDWTYYENGAAVTKWVAAGTNWFYVKEGVMLRNSWVANNSTGSKWYYVNNEGQMVSNTTVNGYVFDANGVWVK